MKKKPLIINILVIICLVFAVGIFFVLNTNKNPSITKSMNNTQNEPTIIPTEFSASFAIYTNGTFRIFTNPMYHDLDPDVYITSKNPNLIIVKKEGITWENFFSTLPFELNNECLTTGTNQMFCSNENYKLQFYLNNKLAENILNKDIRPGDRLLITYDLPDPKNLSEQLQSIPEPK